MRPMRDSDTAADRGAEFILPLANRRQKFFSMRLFRMVGPDEEIGQLLQGRPFILGLEVHPDVFFLKKFDEAPPVFVGFVRCLQGLPGEEGAHDLVEGDRGQDSGRNERPGVFGDMGVAAQQHHQSDGDAGLWHQGKAGVEPNSPGSAGKKPLRRKRPGPYPAHGR